MIAQEAMTRDVVAVGLNATVREIAALLVKHRISAVPVIAKDGGIWAWIKAESSLSSSLVNVSVKEGNVELYGGVTTDAQRRALRALVEAVPGVVRVENNVTLLPKVVAA